MTAKQLCYGRRVIWRGLHGEIIGIQWNQHTVRACVKVAGMKPQWTKIEELEVPS